MRAARGLFIRRLSGQPASQPASQSLEPAQSRAITPRAGARRQTQDAFTPPDENQLQRRVGSCGTNWAVSTGYQVAFTSRTKA